MAVRSENVKVVILGANGTMGAGAAAMFAGGGCHVTMLARDLAKAREGLTDAQSLARAEAVADSVVPGTYEQDMDRAVAEATLIFETLAEDLPLKQQYFQRVDKHRRPDAIVATCSSGLSIAAMAQGRSDSFRRSFLGIHLFNPPHMITGTEVVPHDATDPAVTASVVESLRTRFGRKVIVARDRPAFAGNRIGFKVLNEAAQLAGEHGVAFIDYLVGPHTGRAMAPLATIDLVGWDVHKAIVDNIHALCTTDEAHACFKLPAYVEKGIAEGHLGDKTPERGGFYRRDGKTVEVLHPGTGHYEALKAPARIDFVERMKSLNRVGRYRDAIATLATASGWEADLARQVVLGYAGYALNRVGEVAESAADVDTIMSFGFNWAPPTVLIDLLGAKDAIAMFQRYQLKVPPIVQQAAANGGKLYTGGLLDFGRTFVG
jgi:3-hydroxyacyl-CoA dehydrogenase